MKIKNWSSSDGSFFRYRSRKYRVGSPAVTKRDIWVIHKEIDVFISYSILIDDRYFVYVVVHPDDFTKYKILETKDITPL